MGQKRKGLFFLLLWLIPYLLFPLFLIPFVGWILALLFIPFNLLRFCFNIYHCIDVVILANRLQEGKPITINECSFFKIPLFHEKVMKQPAVVTDSAENPTEYFTKLSRFGFAPILQPVPSAPYQSV